MIEILLFCLVAVTITAIVRHNVRIQAARDQMAARQTFEHIAVPILVTSNFPDDPTVHLRAQAWREKLRAAGNRYSETLPVVAYPFSLGANGEGGLNTWRTYQCNVALKFSQMLHEWDEKIALENPALSNQFIFNQRSSK